MATPFANKIWNHAHLYFVIHSQDIKVDKFGVPSSEGKEIKVSTKIKKIGQGTQKNLKPNDAASEADETYACKIFAIDDDKKNVSVPVDLFPGDVGEGLINGIPCKVTIKSVAQSSIKILHKKLGNNLIVEVNYRVRRGSSN
jgi:hypothetical protein